MNPFRDWKADDVKRHNERVSKITHSPARERVLEKATGLCSETSANRQGQVMSALESRSAHASAGMVTSFSANATPGHAAMASDGVRLTRFFTVHITPMGAPRMTRRDKWLKPRRPVVQRYFDFRDVVQCAAGDIATVPDAIYCTFNFPMPKSWMAKKRAAMNGKPHRQRPDKDNCEKAVLDSLFLEDGGVWCGSQQKLWTTDPVGWIDITLAWY